MSPRDQSKPVPLEQSRRVRPTVAERLWAKVDRCGPMGSPYLGRCWLAEANRLREELAVSQGRFKSCCLRAERAEAEVERLSEALSEALVPLATMHLLGNDWKHPVLRKWWNKMVSAELREQIKRGHDLALAALSESPIKGPVDE